MFKDLQNYIPEKTFVTADDMNELRKVAQFLNNFFGQNALADPTGLAFRKPTRYRDVQLIRIGNTQDGQGKYDAWTLLPTTNTAHLGSSNNVSLSEFFDDNEPITFWDARDDAAAYNSPSGTNRLHSFGDSYIPAIRLPFTEGTGTNARRVFAAYSGGNAASSNVNLVALTGTWPGVGSYQGNRDSIFPTSVTTTDDVSSLFSGSGTNAVSGTNCIILNPTDVDFPGGHMINVSGSYNVRFLAMYVGANVSGQDVLIMTGAQIKIGCPVPTP